MMVTEKEQEKTSEVESGGDELDSLKQENESLARELKSRDATIVRLEQALAAKDNARALMERVRQEMEAEAAKTRVPAGAPQRAPIDLSSLSAREKIQYAIGGSSS